MEKSILIAVNIFSFIIFILGVKNIIKRWYILKRGTKTTAILVGLNQTKNIDDVSYWPVIEFYDNGELIEQILNQSMPNFVSRKIILVTYLKINNKYEIINHENKIYYYTSCVMTFISGLYDFYFLVIK